MLETLDQLNEPFIKSKFEYRFQKIGIKVKDISILPEGIKIITGNGDKILVETADKMTWKLNGLLIGEVMGKEIYDVVGDYEYELKK